MKDGGVHQFGPTEDVMNPETIFNVFGVTTEVTRDPYNDKYQISFQYRD